MSHVTGALAESDLLMAALHESMRRRFGECFPLSVRAAAEVLGSVSVCFSGRDSKAAVKAQNRVRRSQTAEQREPGQDHDSFSC